MAGRGRNSKDNIIPCRKSPEFSALINNYADDLRQAAFSIGSHGLTKREFIESGLFDAAVERIRGQKAARTTNKYQFIMNILEQMQGKGAIRKWTSTGGDGRMDFKVKNINGTETAIEAKGCLDGNNTTIFERPDYADELIVWSLCQNTGSDPRKNAWSGLHTRLGVEMISRPEKKVDAVIIWDELCGTSGRPCPKGEMISSLSKPAPCIYLFPAKTPCVEDPFPKCHTTENVEFIKALKKAFEFNYSNIFNLRIKVQSVNGRLARQTFVSQLSVDGQDEVRYEPSSISPIKR